MRALGALLIALVAAPAFAADKQAVLEQHEAYRKHERELEHLALGIRRAQQRLIDARDALMRFRQGKTPEQLSDEGVLKKAQALMGAAKRAQKAYEAKGQGDGAKRYRELKGDRIPRMRKRLVVALDGLLAESPGDLQLRRMRAALRVDRGRFQEGRADLRVILEAAPDDPVALTLLGRCEEDHGAVEQALRLYRQALAGEPSDERRARAALVLFRLNAFDEAQTLRNQVGKKAELPAALQLEWDAWLAKPQLERLCQSWKAEAALRSAEAKKDDLPRVELRTERGRIVLELFEDQAPNTVASFVTLVEAKFFDGLTWHRVHPFYVQSGDPSTRKGATSKKRGPGYRVTDELGKDARGHFRGSLALANESGPNTGGSQFSVLLRPLADLNGRLTCFGRVLEGFEVVGKLQQGDRIHGAKVLRKRAHPYRVKKTR